MWEFLGWVLVGAITGVVAVLVLVLVAVIVGSAVRVMRGAPRDRRTTVFRGGSES